MARSVELTIFGGSSAVTDSSRRATVSELFSCSSATSDEGSLFSMRSSVKPPVCPAKTERLCWTAARSRR